MIKLTENDKDIIRHLGYPKIVNLSSGSYLIKKDFQNTSVNEIIGQKIADIMGLVCPRYYIVEVDNESYLLSEDLNQYGKFMPALEFSEKYKDAFESYPINKLYQDESWYDEDAKKILHGNSLYDIWSFFENNYSPDISKRLMNDILKIYIFDILFLNYDRDPRNWGILTEKNQAHIVILDNEMIFSKKDTLEKDEENNDLEEEEKNDGSYLAETVALNINFMETHPKIYDDFRYFLKESSLEFITLFKYYFDLITPEFLNGLIEQIERKYNIKTSNKEEMLEIYKKHRLSLMQVYDEEIKRKDNHAR